MIGTSRKARLNGVVWAALLLPFVFARPAAAQTSCGATDRFTLDWNAQTQGYQNTTTRVYNATDGLLPTPRTEAVTVSYGGDLADFVPISFGGSIGTITTPYILVFNVGGIAATESTLHIGVVFDAYVNSIGTNVDTVATNFGFASPVRDLTFRILDVDYSAAQFRDWVQITGTAVGGGTVVPRIASPYPAGTPRNNQTNPGNTAPSTSNIGPLATPSIPNSNVLGITGNATNTQDLGNLTVSFSTPITAFQIRYANGPTTTMGGTPGQQGFAIHDLSFCTMPKISLTKVSAVVSDPINSTTNPKAIPGADVDYTITMINNGGSAVDLNTQVITDALPANFEFFNGDIDTGTAGTQNFVFTAGTSGLSFAAANLTYSSTGAAPFTYAPIAGYDPNVRGMRFAPQGSMAANSSFTLRFRGRVKP